MTWETDIGDTNPTSGIPDSLGFQRATWWLLGGAGKFTLRRWTDELAELELTPSQYKLLSALDETGPLGQQRLAELVGIDPRNAVPIIETSVERGLLTRSVDPTDRRRRVLELSPTGLRVAAKLRTLNAQLEEQLLEPLSPADRTALRRILQTLIGAADPQPSAIDPPADHAPADSVQRSAPRR
ncbi:MarR family winged helix-turn-helix transcriptional regulator [Nocardia vaccinii]|uniref:MarR family winged helix-turn-helix transcriptional regulator n=1 Tax=Nocardia vaccinii TaxID=1822 RepID=UPI00082CCCF0|nr:MarR family winged helix-turn-helix transcriptional regulator [Nocardia vaccinii]